MIIDRSGERRAFGYGETLPPSALPLLQRLDLLQLFEENSYRKTFGYHSCWGNDQVTNLNFYHHHPFKNGLKIDKQKILNALQETSQPKIIPYDHSASISSENTGAQSILLDEKIEVQGKLFVDATGRKRALLKKFNIDSVAFDSLISFSCHLPKIKHPKLVHEVYVESFEQGWGIVSALNEAQNVFSVFTNKGSEIHKQLGRYENWRSVLSNTKYLKDFLVDKIHPKVIGGNSNSSKPQRVTGKNWLALGDAAMSYDPLSSHGITNAVYTAMIATESIKQKLIDNDSNALKIYEDTINQIFDQYLSSKNQLYIS
jgi:flavin-dependent dehydrogenase